MADTHRAHVTMVLGRTVTASTVEATPCWGSPRIIDARNLPCPAARTRCPPPRLPGAASSHSVRAWLRMSAAESGRGQRGPGRSGQGNGPGQDDETEPDARFTYANERTFLAWNRTALALVVAGLAIIQLLPPFPGVPGGRHMLALPLLASAPSCLWPATSSGPATSAPCAAASRCPAHPSPGS
jgi:hypothetical protein